jgi:hypothetical protein
VRYAWQEHEGKEEAYPRAFICTKTKSHIKRVEYATEKKEKVVSVSDVSSLCRGFREESLQVLISK